MSRNITSRIVLTLIAIIILRAMLNAAPVKGWSNGGFSTDPSNPSYGTHDWIAQHVLDWLPDEEKQFISDNLAAYLYGTELPDNSGAPDGIGDSGQHHAYFNDSGIMVEDWAAVRASWEFERVLYFLKLEDLANAAKTVGIMSHYIADVSVYGHVMGSGSCWGAEIHHSDYEDYVYIRTNNYSDDFNSYLSYDGSLDLISAYNATENLAYDTTFDVDGDLTCVWMDNNYNWSDPLFRDRAGESLNLAVNYLADVLHTIFVTASEENFKVFPIQDVSLLFENITAEGSTTANKTETGPESPPDRVVKQYYDIKTTTNYSDMINIEILYDKDPASPGVGRNLTAEEEESVQLIQWNEASQQWANITTYIDRKNNLIGGNTSHLSIFGVTCINAAHDIAVTNVTLWKNIVGQGYNLLINVTVKNGGAAPEASTITLFANTTVIATLALDNLLNGTSTVFIFSWNTSGLAIGNYTISAYVEPVLNETHTSDNFLSDGTVYVSFVGDVDIDGKVDMKDIGVACIAFGSFQSHPEWNQIADIDDNGIVELKDIVLIAKNFGKH